MKKTTIKELAKMVANKVGLNYVPNTGREFREFIRDIYPQFDLKYENLDDQMYNTQNANVPDINIEMPAEILKDHFDEIDKATGLSESSYVVYIDENSDALEDYKDLNGEEVFININEDNLYSVKQILQNCHEICKKYGCKMQVEVGSSAKNCEYCDFNLTWEIDEKGIEGENLYFSFTDDNGINLMGGLYWISEMFAEDSFEDIDKFGIEFSYQE